MHYGVTQDDDLTLHTHGSVVTDFGPFADVADVLDAVRACVNKDAVPPFGSWLLASPESTSSTSPLPPSDCDQPSLW